MSKKKGIAIVLVLLALVVVGYWIAEGANIWTKNQVQVEVEDELFGTTTTEWRDDFQPGLEFVAPVTVVLLIAGSWFGIRARKEAQHRIA